MAPRSRTKGLPGRRGLRGVGARLGKAVQDLRQSYWAIPAGLSLLSVALAFAMVSLDRAVGATILDGPAISPDGARTILSLIAQSIIGVTGVMFSMTLVAVSFASGNFGPRLIGNFMRDRVNQWSLGILVATFVFALLVARAVADGDVPGGGEGGFVPHLSILVAVLLALACTGVVIYFVHHIPEMINIASITASLGRRALSAIKKRAEAQRDARGDGFEPPEAPPDAEIAMRAAGYIVSLDLGTLREIADRRGLRIDVPHDVGTFVSEATVVLRIWGSPLAGDEVDDDPEEELRRCLALGDDKREEQNPAFLLDQLVEIAARALSPGVNDPFTAINCVNWMQAGAVAAARHAGGLSGRQDGPVRTPELTFTNVLDAGLGASRPYTASDPLSDTHLRSMLDRLEEEVGEGSPHWPVLDAFLRRMRDMPQPDGADCVRTRTAIRSSG